METCVHHGNFDLPCTLPLITCKLLIGDKNTGNSDIGTMTAQGCIYISSCNFVMHGACMITVPTTETNRSENYHLGCDPRRRFVSGHQIYNVHSILLSYLYPGTPHPGTHTTRYRNKLPERCAGTTIRRVLWVLVGLYELARRVSTLPDL